MDDSCSQCTLRVPVEADLVRLVQVFGNIVDNAIQHSDTGGRIRVEMRSDGERATVRVEDEGAGIRGPMLSELFDLSSRASAESGGLGLTIAHRLVRTHEGTISAASEGFGHGATFTVELPLVSSSLAETSDPNSSKPHLRDYRVRLKP